MNLIEDTIDLSAYMGEDSAAVKVRRASQFTDELLSEFEPKSKAGRKPEMFSTKLRDVIEFRPGEVTCWAGFSGHRKSMFTGQVALDLLVQTQRVLMASFEMFPRTTMARMASQAAGMARPSNAWLIDFSEWTDDRLWIFDHFGRLSPDQVVAVCRYFTEELQGQHIFIDSMMMVVASEEHADEQKQFVTDLVRIAQETGAHIHLVAHCRKPAGGSEDKPPSKYEIRGSAAISDQAHNVITIWANKAKKAAADASSDTAKKVVYGDTSDALVTIEKQRNGSWEGRVKLWFDDDSLRFIDSADAVVEPYSLLTSGDSE